MTLSMQRTDSAECPINRCLRFVDSDDSRLDTGMLPQNGVRHRLCYSLDELLRFPLHYVLDVPERTRLL